jgi:inosine-uridine nucleoside N-ribohydrolase
MTAELTTPEENVLQELQRKKPSEPDSLILFTDPNKDPDDVATYVMAAQLAKDGHIHVKAVVTTLGDEKVRTQRAQLAKGVFNGLGLPEVSVAVGRDYPMDDKQRQEHAKFLAGGQSLLASETEVRRDSREALLEQLRGCADRSVTFLVIAGMSDAQDLLDASLVLVKQKIKQVAIMGGVSSEMDSDGFVQPDDRAYNNLTDFHACQNFYRGVQEAGIPLKVLSKEAAYQAAVSPGFYESIARTEHPVGQYLKNVQKSALQGLWEGIASGLIPNLTFKWFFETFTSTRPINSALETMKQHPLSFDQIWQRVTKLNLYDPLTLFVAVEAAADLLFKSFRIHADEKSLVFTIGEQEVVNPGKARTLMSALSKSSLSLPNELAQANRGCLDQ